MKKIYLSSKISGLKKEEWMNNFNRAEADLVITCCLNDGDPLQAEAINPANFSPDIENPTWTDYILEDIRVLSDNADAIYLFGEWWSSLGAWIELFTAIRTEKDVITEGWWSKKLVKVLVRYFNKNCVHKVAK